MRTEVVLLNWKRPANLIGIIHAFREQSVPVFITVIDSAPETKFELLLAAGSFDRYRRVYDDHGPFTRYSAIAHHHHEFTLFHDDDMLPGTRFIEHMETAADKLLGDSGEFGVLGQFGRWMDGGEYNTRDVLRLEGAFRPVDLVVRSYFTRTRHLHQMLALKSALGLTSVREDDMLLGEGLLRAGMLSYLTPADTDPETLAQREHLDESHALSAKPGHLAARKDFWRMLRQPDPLNERLEPATR